MEKPKATMFVRAPMPEPFATTGSLEVAMFLPREGAVAVSPGVGFGELGDTHVRLALVENEERIRQAVRGIRRTLAVGPSVVPAAHGSGGRYGR